MPQFSADENENFQFLRNNFEFHKKRGTMSCRRRVEMFFVYEHLHPETDVCFYVGKTSNSRRMYYFIRSNSKYNEMIDDLKSRGCVPVVNVLHKTWSENEALQLEKERILFYGIENLFNIRINCGGRMKHGLGRKMREEIKKAISKSMEKRPSSRKGIPLSEETKRKMRETKLKNRQKSTWTEALEMQRVRV
jgi:hypothetical protein